MTRAIVTAVGALATCVPLGAEDLDEAAVMEAGAKFRSSCMECHQPPDLRFATDRAWLGQIRKTA